MQVVDLTLAKVKHPGEAEARDHPTKIDKAVGNDFDVGGEVARQNEKAAIETADDGQKAAGDVAGEGLEGTAEKADEAFADWCIVPWHLPTFYPDEKLYQYLEILDGRRLGRCGAYIRDTDIEDPFILASGGPYHDWFVAGMRDTPRSQQLMKDILADAPNILRHYQVMRQFAEQVKKTGKIADAHRALWDMYVALAVATSFTLCSGESVNLDEYRYANRHQLVPYEGGSAEVEDVTATGRVGEERGREEGGRHEEDIGPATSTRVYVGNPLRH
ncbi:hypothetical protein A0H81_09543 [Grifola frondosa]|uniref:Uncharacterized protein n=1 Tax=Grifola frondosa TaxID=5627 RepID=A0A1C7M1U4_GRIFR|nr:hypothetical protein A0H81_09543 [Grifola frondosa]